MPCYKTQLTSSTSSKNLGTELNFLCNCSLCLPQISYSNEATYTTMHKLRALKCMLSVVSSDHQSLQYLSDINTDDDEEHLEFDLEKHLQVFSGLRSKQM